MKELHELENNVFEVKVNNKIFQVEFKVQALPNDFKMLAFLAGELTNSAFYFSKFANVNQGDANDISKSFDINGQSSWKPFAYEKRITDSNKVEFKKKELAKKKIKTSRASLTTYISKELKSHL